MYQIKQKTMQNLLNQIELLEAKQWNGTITMNEEGILCSLIELAESKIYKQLTYLTHIILNNEVFRIKKTNRILTVFYLNESEFTRFETEVTIGIINNNKIKFTNETIKIN